MLFINLKWESKLLIFYNYHNNAPAQTPHQLHVFFLAFFQLPRVSGVHPVFLVIIERVPASFQLQFPLQPADFPLKLPHSLLLVLLTRLLQYFLLLRLLLWECKYLLPAETEQKSHVPLFIKTTSVIKFNHLKFEL